MKATLTKNHRLIFYLSWTILTLMQSGLTELLDDEAYYWVYSKFLDWGYFDHPPMIAVLIKGGYAIFHNELGVRLLLVVLNVLSLVIIEKLLVKKEPFVFYAITLSLAVLQLSGFVAVPDIPLIFFTALFFLVYKKFLEKDSLLNTVLMGVVIAALLYSKYHAALIILLVLLSNLKLFTRYQTYIVALIALILFTPHLLWQFDHNWVSFRYHLFESNVNPYKFSFTLEYIGGQIFLAGPIAGIILLPAAFLYKTKNIFERGLKFVLAGFYIFFLLTSFRGKVEANWTSPAIVPLVILSHAFLIEKLQWKKWLFRLLPLTMLLVLIGRVVMIVDIVPFKEIKKRYHAWNGWPQEMKKKTGGMPVVFENSYQRASKYWFYSGQTTYSLNWYRERRNNYNFWPIEDSLLGKKVFILDIYNLDSFPQTMPTPIGAVGYKYDSSFSSFAKICANTNPEKLQIHAGETAKLSLEFRMSRFYHSFIMEHPDLPVKVTAGIFNKNGWVQDAEINRSFYELIKTGPKSIEINTSTLPRGKYYVIFSLFTVGTITPTHNSNKIELLIE